MTDSILLSLISVFSIMLVMTGFASSLIIGKMVTSGCLGAIIGDPSEIVWLLVYLTTFVSIFTKNSYCFNPSSVFTTIVDSIKESLTVN